VNVDDRRPPITPQLALRVAILGGIALALFAVVFFRLWFLQVLSGDQYLVEARENRTRDVRIQAPRGEIVDRRGRVLVDNRQAVVVQLEPQALPEEEIVAAAEWGQAMTRRSKRPKGRKGEPVPIPPIPTAELRERFRRLGRVLGMRPSTIQRRAIEQLAVVPYSAVTVRSDVPRAVVGYLKERKEKFPGVEADRVFLRSYPRETLAAQLLGYVGEISPQELRQRRNRGVKQGTIVGKAGLEYTYDRYLRGRDGAKVLRVDANGRFSSDRPVNRREPIPGRQLRLSLDVGLQQAGQDNLSAIGGGLPGAFVAMNPRSGEVYALGSLPTFDPSVFAKPITQSKFEELTSDDNGAPLINRAIGGVYATGSTFKPITALAALDEGLITPDTVISDPGCIRIGTREACNAGKVANGPVALRRALQVSSDVYFYVQGINLFEVGPEEPLQRTAKRLGLGRKTGIDLSDERPGQIPGREWRADINEQERRCRRKERTDYCGYALEIRPYNVGDNVNLAVGQGEIAASPLQMAVAYSAIVNGGEVPRPHLGLEIQDALGRPVQRIDPGEARRVRIAPEHRQAIVDGLAMAARDPGGTSAHVFASWPHGELPVFGKTGTAEVPFQGQLVDQSWYVAYVPAGRRSIVLAVTVERGGFGADRAAPIACRMLRAWFGQPGSVCDGASKPSAARRAD
jgi:penicillin-binding protein 2